MVFLDKSSPILPTPDVLRGAPEFTLIDEDDTMDAAVKDIVIGLIIIGGGGVFLLWVFEDGPLWFIYPGIIMLFGAVIIKIILQRLDPLYIPFREKIISIYST